jgi:hypothetical protein
LKTALVRFFSEAPCHRLLDFPVLHQLLGPLLPLWSNPEHEKAYVEMKGLISSWALDRNVARHKYLGARGLKFEARVLEADGPTGHLVSRPTSTSLPLVESPSHPTSVGIFYYVQHKKWKVAKTPGYRREGSRQGSTALKSHASPPLGSSSATIDADTPNDGGRDNEYLLSYGPVFSLLTTHA